MTPLIELGDKSQRLPIDIEVGADGRPVLRIRPGIPITGVVVNVLNDLLADG